MCLKLHHHGHLGADSRLSFPVHRAPQAPHTSLASPVDALAVLHPTSPFAVPTEHVSALGISEKRATVGAMQSRPKTSGVLIKPLRDSQPMLAESFLIAGFHSEFVYDAEHRLLLLDEPLFLPYVSGLISEPIMERKVEHLFQSRTARRSSMISAAITSGSGSPAEFSRLSSRNQKISRLHLSRWTNSS
jgi:hypothetical protein